MDEYKFAAKVLKSRKSIAIDNTLMRGLGYDSTRDFFKALGDWGYSTDFGHFSNATDDNVQSYVKAFIRDCFNDE